MLLLLGQLLKEVIRDQTLPIFLHLCPENVFIIMLTTSWSQEGCHDSSHHICVQGKKEGEEMAPIPVIIVVLLLTQNNRDLLIPL